MDSDIVLTAVVWFVIGSAVTIIGLTQVNDEAIISNHIVEKLKFECEVKLPRNQYCRPRVAFDIIDISEGK